MFIKNEKVIRNCGVGLSELEENGFDFGFAG